MTRSSVAPKRQASAPEARSRSRAEGRGRAAGSPPVPPAGRSNRHSGPGGVRTAKRAEFDPANTWHVRIWNRGGVEVTRLDEVSEYIARQFATFSSWCDGFTASVFHRPPTKVES